MCWIKAQDGALINLQNTIVIKQFEGEIRCFEVGSLDSYIVIYANHENDFDDTKLVFSQIQFHLGETSFISINAIKKELFEENGETGLTEYGCTLWQEICGEKS